MESRCNYILYALILFSLNNFAQVIERDIQIPLFREAISLGNGLGLNNAIFELLYAISQISSGPNQRHGLFRFGLGCRF